MIARLIQIGPDDAKHQQMKSVSNKTALLIGAILFWAVVLPAASVVFTVAALWTKIEVSMRAGAIRPMNATSRLPPRRSSQEEDQNRTQEYDSAAAGRYAICRDLHQPNNKQTERRNKYGYRQEKRKSQGA